MYLKWLFVVLAIISLSACSRLGSGQSGTRIGTAAPAAVASNSSSAVQATTSPAASTQASLSLTDITAFIDRSAHDRLNTSERNEAASAQYYALQFGRPGAPRQWQGTSGASGKVSVGPYVRVNQLDCREFSHEVIVGGTTYPKRGTACREADGGWAVF